MLRRGAREARDSGGTSSKISSLEKPALKNENKVGKLMLSKHGILHLQECFQDRE